MKFAAALLATSAAALSQQGKFMQYLTQHSKSYLTVEEFNARQALFNIADDFVVAHNQTNASFTVGHNKFSDMSEGEKAQTRGRNQRNVRSASTHVFQDEFLPSSVDWRSAGAVNAVQDQGQCGSCWAFSSVASLEGAHAVKSGELLKFSEQQLVDCAFVQYGNFGCNGGLEQNAFTYWESNAAVSESAYPYTATRGSCAAGSVNDTGVAVSTYTDVTPESQSQTKAAVAQQPISIAIEADKLVFQLYTSGVFDSAECGTNLDHAVALVGYGSDAGQDYFILRNSWGTTWGESGYMRIADQGDGAGVCGFQLEPTYPTATQ
jgi:C1A family cysteine protease